MAIYLPKNEFVLKNDLTDTYNFKKTQVNIYRTY